MFDGVVLSGGAMKGIGQLGALHFHFSKGNLNCAEIFAGTSIGSAGAMLLSLDYTPFEIFSEIIDQKFVDMTDPHILEFPSMWGVYDMNIFISNLERMVRAKVGSILTLEDHYKYTKKELIIIVHNVDTMEEEIFDWKTHPKCPITEAVRMSCNLPNIFQKIKYNGHYYADGGISNNYALSYIEKRYKYTKRLLGITVSGFDSDGNKDSYYAYNYKIFLAISRKMQELQNVGIQEKAHSIELFVKNMDSHILEIDENDKQLFLEIIRKIQDKERFSYCNKTHSIELHFENVSAINFEMTEDEKKILFKTGFEQAKKMYKEYCDKRALLKNYKIKDGWEFE